MTHPTEALTALLDNALPAPERAEVEAHLAACAACRAERERLAAAIALLRRLPPAPAPSLAFEARFYARLAAERESARRGVLERWRERLGWRAFAPGLAGVATAASVFLYVGHLHRADEAAMAEHLDLLENWEAVASVDAVHSPDDLEVVRHLDELAEGRP